MTDIKVKHQERQISLTIDYSGIVPMLEICEQLLKGTLREEELLLVLDHSTYRFEFSRYKSIISKEEFIAYFLKLLCIEENAITNRAMKAHHTYYRHLLDNPEIYQAKAAQLHSVLVKSDFSKQIGLAMDGLPDDLHIPELKYLFSISIGPSFGYIFDGGMHFDFLRMVKDKLSLDILGSTIAHETHHMGMSILFQKIDFTALPLEEQFYLFFSGEGLAVKYCNNAEGVISKAIGNGSKNIGLDSFSWEYLNNDFEKTITHFKKTIRKIRNGEIKRSEELEQHIKEYWMSSHTEDQEPEEIPKLQHFRLYSLGNDVWGVIHDCFGKNAVYDTVKNPHKFVDTFNKAVRKIGREDLQI